MGPAAERCRPVPQRKTQPQRNPVPANPFLNETHDPALRSWVEGSGEGDFPIQNLPFASFRRARSNEAFRCGVAIGDRIVDLGALAARKLFAGAAAEAALAGSQPRLNALMSLGPN